MGAHVTLEKLKEWWSYVYVIGTIFLNRVYVLLGAIWGVLIVTDLSPFFTDPKYAAAWLIFTGIVGEFVRRYNATDLEQ